MKYLNLTLLLLLVFYGALLLGNNNYLIGLTENHLVEINPTTAETNIITNLNFPNNINTLKNLVYIPNHCLFYTIGNFGQNPSLISISWTGNVNVIGQITLNNDVVYVAEGLTYNTIEEELYVSISTQSLFSSTIAKIDTATAICETVTTVTTLDNDIDSMIFVDNELFIFDGTPNSNISSYYLLDFTNISLNSNPTLLASTIHYSCTDFALFNNHLYIPLPSFELYQHDLSASQFSLDFIGHINGTNLGNVSIRGIEYVENYKPYNFNIDTTICLNTSIEITPDIPIGSTVQWNTGEQTETIMIEEAGMYWADILLENCIPIKTDTITVNFEECDDCANILNQIEAQLNLPNDTILCNNNVEYGLDLEMSDEFEIIWSDGTIGNNISITETGNYSASFNFEDCYFTTDTITVIFEECDTRCSYSIPNAFSPNNDNINDYFSVKFDDTCEIENFEMQIYNRWGNRIIYTTDNSWNGMKQANSLEIGVYVYFIKFDVWENGKLNNIKQKGNVTLIR